MEFLGLVILIALAFPIIAIVALIMALGDLARAIEYLGERIERAILHVDRPAHRR